MDEKSEKALFSHPQTHCVVRIRELFPSLEDNKKVCIYTHTNNIVHVCTYLYTQAGFNGNQDCCAPGLVQSKCPRCSYYHH